MAYLLIQALRDLGLKGTSEERAQAHTIRVKLLKSAARIRITARKVWVELSCNCPFEALFREVSANLSAGSLVVRESTGTQPDPFTVPGKSSP